LPLPSSKIVESVIALSIAATALHNLRPVIRNREWLIAFVFGLFHGMGFASLVGGLDVSKGTKMVSLLGRNVGIEIGQAVVVLMIFPGLFLLRRTTWYRVVLIVTSIGLAIVALGWMIERLFEKDLRISKVIEPIVEFPRSIVWAALFTAGAGAVFLFERQRGRLRATVDPASVGRDPDLVLSGSSGTPQ
jgi:HupE / UreJ protein